MTIQLAVGDCRSSYYNGTSVINWTCQRRSSAESITDVMFGLLQSDATDRISRHQATMAAFDRTSSHGSRRGWSVCLLSSDETYARERRDGMESLVKIGLISVRIRTTTRPDRSGYYGSTRVKRGARPRVEDCD